MMLSALHRLRSFGAKVMLIVTATAGVAIIAVSLIAGVRDYLQRREQLVETISSQALIVAANSSAPLAFADLESATEALSAFRFVDAVSHSVLVDAAGNEFARFSREGEPALQVQQDLPVGHWRRDDGLVLVLQVADRSGSHGWLQVHYNERRLHREAMISILITTLFSAAAMLLAYLLARKARSVLVAPVAELDRTAQQVIESGDFGLRAERLSNDELGRLTDRFNTMLGHVQSSRAQLVEARLSAERASRLKDEFVATLSHELRTPMAPIMAWTQLLRIRAQNSPDIEQGLEVIERNSRMLIQIIDDLLDMSRIISGNMRLDVQPVNLVETINRAIETVRTAADSRQIELQVVLDPNAGQVRGDPARLQQVMWNLLSNAIKFTPKDGRVQVTLQRVDSHVEISVADSGAGIEPDFLPFVFERFRQQDGSMTRQHGGLGLGLAIVKQLVDLHGGSVKASSGGTGQGACFVVSLPLAALGTAGDAKVAGPSEPAASARPLQGAPSLDGIDVLVVEDQPDMRQLIRVAIEQAGGTVRDAGSMAEAVALFDARTPDLVVSDIGMPGGDGYELIRHLRNRPVRVGGAVPAIALTAYARSEDRTRSLLAGYQLHVAKPVEPIELLAAISSLARR